MENKIKLGIIKETKNPPDRRVALPPQLCVELLKKFPNAEVYVQPSELRSYKDQEYIDAGLTLQEDLSNCDVLLGVKEVKIDKLIPNKKYIFFSHTTKKQPYNIGLLQTVMQKGITLMDHENFTDINNLRLVAFGFWAGLVGAYNGLIAFGKRNKLFDLKHAYDCHDMQEMFAELEKIKLPPIKILISGGGRVAHGAMETISKLNIKKVNPQDFLLKEYEEAVYCQIDPWHYTKRKDGTAFDLEDFFNHASKYESTFKPFTKVTDMYIPCHFWDPKSPVFMTKEDMREEDFKIQVIADVSCDVEGPIPSTIKASTIADPIFGYNPISEKEDEPFAEGNITVMSVDNLPGELPRDASIDFGKGLIDKIFPSLFGEDNDGIIDRASITVNGKLNTHFSYLQDWVDGKE